MADVKVKDEQAKNIATDSILKSAQTGAISAQTAKTMVEKKLAEKDLAWYNWKNGVSIGKDIAVGIGGLGVS